MSIRTIVIVVPARDEQELIERCLAALERARARVRRGTPTLEIRTIVVADRCHDDTVRLAREFAEVEVVEIDAGNVGAARLAGVDHAVAGRNLSETWIASTDADSEVPTEWLVCQLDLAEQGADVVVGTVRPRFADLSGGQIRGWIARHLAGRGTLHVHGTNLGVRATAYAGVGGFQGLPEHEDVDLVARLTAEGARVVSTPGIEVVTSGRLVGRTPGGYAAFLARERLLEPFSAQRVE